MKKKTKYFGWVAIYGDEIHLSIHLSKSQIRYALDNSGVIEPIYQLAMMQLRELQEDKTSLRIC